MSEQRSDSFKGYAILELMGHRRLAGMVSDELVFGVNLIRIDIPNGDMSTTQWYHPNSLYALTPCSEELAKAFAKRNQPEPVHRWELPAPEPDRRAEDLRDAHTDGDDEWPE